MHGDKIHILFSSSAAGTLRQVLREEDIGDEVICLHDHLSYGPVASLDPKSRFEALLREELIDRKDWSWLPADSHQFWSRCATTKRQRILWRAPRSPNEMAGFLAYMQRFGHLPCDIVGLEEAANRLSRSNGAALGIVYGLGELSKEHIRILLGCARPFPPEEAASAGQLWEQLVREDALLRVPHDEGMVSAPETLVDERFLLECSGEWKPVLRILGNLLGRLPEEQGFTLDLFFLEWRLKKLLAGGELESREDSSSSSRFRHMAWVRRR